jgi:WD40 repeat protein
LKGEKTNAHNDYIRTVNYSPDGTKIVSGGDDQTIKVWDSGALWSLKLPLRPKLSPPGSSTGTLELKATKENAHIERITSVAFNPLDGKTIASSSADKTIKVWDSGELWSLKMPVLPKSTPPGSPSGNLELPWRRTAGPGPPQCRYRKSGVNFQTGIAHLPVTETGI